MAVLHVTSARDTTTDRVIVELDQLGVESLRINTEEFPTRSSFWLTLTAGEPSGLLRTDSGRIARIGEVRVIYHRRPLPSSFDSQPRMSAGSRRFASRESAAGLYGFLDSLDAVWVDDRDVVKRAERKAPQLRVAEAVGFETPKTLITNEPSAATAFVASASGPVIAKTLRSPLVDDKSGRMAYTRILGESELRSLDLLRLAPCIFQVYLEKRLEHRVTLVGDKVFTVAIHSQEVPDASVDWRKADYRQLRHEATALPLSAQDSCRAFARRYGLRFATYDLVERYDGSLVFLECNPSGEWGWLEAATGLPISAEIAALLAELDASQD